MDDDGIASDIQVQLPMDRMYSHLRYRDYVDITKVHIWEVVCAAV